MENKTLMKVGFETAVTLNALFIITWILLAIFPGVYYFSIWEIAAGFQYIFLNIWFYLFAITLAIALLLRIYLEGEKEADPGGD